MTHLDTHVAIWLAQGRGSQFSRTVRRRLDDAAVVLSPMVVLELQILFEIGRLSDSGAVLAQKLLATTGVQVSQTPFDRIVTAAIEETWTRDPFDRLIVAHARADGAHLVTKDERLLKNYPLAVW